MKNKKYIFYAILAAVLYALSTPISKLLLNKLSPTFVAALLYLGAGLGMTVVGYIRHKTTNFTYKKFTHHELPAILGMIALDILAPILLLIGLKNSQPENVALLNNFEIVATSLFAAFLFKEVIKKRLKVAIICVTMASFILSFENIQAFTFSLGSIFVVLAAIAWGLENNLTRRLSFNDPLMVVVIKGIFSGIGSLIISWMIGSLTLNIGYILVTLLLGFVAYGLSIFFYVTAQRELGAAKTSTFYAVAPFVGAFLALIIFTEIPGINFLIALVLMGVGSYFASTE
jgi:drug/metabolite transporter (DMT)-like permease